jgi:uncharacterized membrane protein YdjX (TVP38/TMEM64 family)
VPQFVLIAAAVVAFGPWTGFAYSWIGTLVSSLVGFWLGRTFGGRLLQDLAGDGVAKFMKLIGKNGFLASLIVRLVPSAPFIVVNMAAGVTPMKLRDFAAGTAVGIIPKIALTAFAGNSIVQALKGGGQQHIVMLVVAVAVWIGCRPDRPRLAQEARGGGLGEGGSRPRRDLGAFDARTSRSRDTVDLIGPHVAVENCSACGQLRD